MRSALAHAGGRVIAARDSREGVPLIKYQLTLPTLGETRRKELAAKTGRE